MNHLKSQLLHVRLTTQTNSELICLAMLSFDLHVQQNSSKYRAAPAASSKLLNSESIIVALMIVRGI